MQFRLVPSSGRNLSSTQAWHEGCQCRPKQNPFSNATPSIWLERFTGSPGAKTNQPVEHPATCEAASVTVGQQIRGGSPDQEHHQAHHSGGGHEQHRHRPPPRHDRSVGPRGRRTRGPPARQPPPGPDATSLRTPSSASARSLYDHFMTENDQQRPTLDDPESVMVKRFLDTTNIRQSL